LPSSDCDDSSFGGRAFGYLVDSRRRRGGASSGFERGRLVQRVEFTLAAAGRDAAGGGRSRRPRLAPRALEAARSERPAHHRAGSGPQAATTPDVIRQVVGQEIERVVKGCWPGRQAPSDFALDDLTPLVEVCASPGAPRVDMDTQAGHLGGVAGHGGGFQRAACHPPTPIEVAPKGRSPVQEFVQC